MDNQMNAPIQYTQTPPPPVVPVEMENGIPVKPFPAEQKWIKRFYNWTGAALLIHIGVALAISIIITLFGELFLAIRFGGLGSFLQDKRGIALLTAIATLAAYLTANLLVFGVGCKVAKINPRPLFTWKNVSVKLLIATTLIALAIQAVNEFFVDTGMDLIISWIDLDIEKLLKAFQTNQGTAGVIMAIYTCIVAPVTEELVFRGFCLKNLSRVNVRFGIIASSLLFGLVHSNIIQFFLAFLIGIVLAHVTVKTGSIFPAIIAHFVVNTSSTILSRFSLVYPETGKMVTVIWFAVMFVGGIAALIVAKKVYKERLPKATPARKNRGWPLYFRSWSLIVITALYALGTILPLMLIPFLPLLKPFLERMY